MHRVCERANLEIAQGVADHVWEVGEIVDLLGKGKNLPAPHRRGRLGPRATVMEAKDLREGCALRASQLVDETMAAISDGEFPVSVPP